MRLNLVFVDPGTARSIATAMALAPGPCSDTPVPRRASEYWSKMQALQMAEIRHRVGISCKARDIYPLLATDEGLSRWWTTDTRGAGEVGSIIEFRFGGGGPDFEVIELIPDRRVVWRHSGEMPPAWMGTEISFELEETGKQTFVNFAHYGWREADAFLAHCSTKWGVFMLSLKSSIETGRGQPYPDDVHIDFDE